ncbi:hypothetical protein C2G38_2171241 [Gigaspora rosea]|uniref:Uncharacterized protein n=1 Tax=Gigaspora rosea TaxID=44941 RepID=A0A397VNI9_9GLOM|nr:hypothetical protein C2G38_2171241 [Gigaspora rosea]
MTMPNIYLDIFMLILEKNILNTSAEDYLSLLAASNMIIAMICLLESDELELEEIEIWMFD